jgi:hypothetical protein
MKKTYLALFVLVLFACKKSTNSPSGGQSTYDATVSYTASAQTLHWNDTAQQYQIDSILGSAECFENNFPKSSDSVFSGNVYEFDFEEQTAANSGITAYGVVFLIPGQNYPNFSFPLNTPIAIDLNSSFYQSLAINSFVIFSSSQAVDLVDSASITLVITRNSNGTIDGTFSALYYTVVPNAPSPTGIGEVTNGVFKNVPLKSK